MLQAAQQAVPTLQSHVAGAQLNVEESNTIQNDVLLQVIYAFVPHQANLCDHLLDTLGTIQKTLNNRTLMTRNIKKSLSPDWQMLQSKSPA